MRKLNVKKLRTIIANIFDTEVNEIDIEVEVDDVYINVSSYCKLYGNFEDGEISLSFTEINCEYYYTTDDIRDLSDMIDRIEENYNY